MQLDKRVEAATKVKEAIQLWRAGGRTEEQIVDTIAKIMAETLPERT